MTEEARYREIWEAEEAIAHIHGWDFSHIHGRYSEEEDLPWDYATVIRRYLREDMRILDYDTGGGEFLCSLNHPPHLTAATEGYPPNVELCRQELLPLGIDFRPCSDPARIPFEDESFDVILNRHGDFCPTELYRLLKKGGIFITQQVGEDNERELVEMLLPGTEKPFSHLNLREQKQAFIDAGFTILDEGESFRPIRFTDIGALVWFARIIEWEFPNFSVARCFDRLMHLQKTLDQGGKIEGTTHRYLIVAQKP
ncbi:MAG: class I SAM-dependent methyltransferase [Clostridia bacterium]|nr:class I SAM-dependent methyltransferase [Clostridia bacterium]